MKKVFVGFGLVFLMVLVAFAITTISGKDDVRAGVPTVPRDKATYGNITFEPPDLFMHTLPLKSWVSGDTGVELVAGHGAVLDAWSFSITGYSEPNALCFNSSAYNADGSRPRLPAILVFDPPVQNISMLVGSGYSAGGTAKIKAFSTSLSKIDQDSITVSGTMQMMSVGSGSANIELLLITGPTTLAIDDIVFN